MPLFSRSECATTTIIKKCLFCIGNILKKTKKNGQKIYWVDLLTIPRYGEVFVCEKSTLISLHFLTVVWPKKYETKKNNAAKKETFSYNTNCMYKWNRFKWDSGEKSYEHIHNILISYRNSIYIQEPFSLKSSSIQHKMYSSKWIFNCVRYLHFWFTISTANTKNSIYTLAFDVQWQRLYKYTMSASQKKTTRARLDTCLLNIMWLIWINENMHTQRGTHSMINIWIQNMKLNYNTSYDTLYKLLRFSLCRI